MILFELNTRLTHERLDRLADPHLYRLAALGFDAIWLMGIWRIGQKTIEESRTISPDFQGSPYAIAEYEVSPELGGEPALRAFVEQAHSLGIKVLVDFIPNHMGVDSPLVSEHPDWVIHEDHSLRDIHGDDTFDHPQGRLAHGKDPYFPAWSDTVQLDYGSPGLRAHQIAVLERLAGIVDGVRCDMAMLVLREQVKGLWYPKLDPKRFDERYPEEFWSEATRKVRAKNPDFVFLAEVYWDKEAYLQQLGFDLTYDKHLFDLLAHDKPAAEVAGHLRDRPVDYHRRSTHFLENHDEDRAAVRFGPRARPAALLSYGIPGAPFVHMGQMQGFTEKIPVQRLAPLNREKPDAELERFYAKLLGLVKDPLFREGDFEVLGVIEGVLGLVRRHEGRAAIVAARLGGGDPKAANPAFAVPLSRLGLQGPVRARDLWSGAVVEHAPGDDGVLRFAAGVVPSFLENQGFLLELTPG